MSRVKRDRAEKAGASRLERKEQTVPGKPSVRTRRHAHQTMGLAVEATPPRPWFIPWSQRDTLSKCLLILRIMIFLVLVAAFARYTQLSYPSGGSSNAVSAWLFLTAAGFFAWSLLLVFALPDVLRGIVEAVGAGRTWILKAATACLAILLLVVLPGWRVAAYEGRFVGTKDFDDQMAISNSYVLLDNKFDVSKMFFRSFLRVGFNAVDLPIAAIAPAEIQSVTRSPSDNYRRIWNIYGDADNPKASSLREHGWLGLFFMAAIAPLLFRLIQLLGMPAPLAMLAGFAGTWFFSRTIEVPVTQTFVFTTGILTALACVAVPEREKTWRNFVIPGLALGFAGLTMNTLAIVGAAIGVYHLTHLVRTRSVRYLAGTLLCYLIAATFLLTWYEAFLRGFVFETKLFNVEVKETEALMRYTPSSWPEFMRMIRIIYGPWYPLALVGLGCVAFLRLRVPGTPLMLSWGILSLAVLVTMPFYFPRFVMYSIPPACWLMVAIPYAAAVVVPRLIRRPAVPGS